VVSDAFAAKKKPKTFEETFTCSMIEVITTPHKFSRIEKVKKFKIKIAIH
jgi:hypothetical protein